MEINLKLFRPYQVQGLKRLGNEYDGGYIVHYPSLKETDYLINYGVGYNVTFEKEFFSITGKPTLSFDPTLKDFRYAIKKLAKKDITDFLRHVKNYVVWLFKERTLPAYKINFINEGIADKDEEDYKTFKYHFNKYNLSNKKFIFKLDVEGAEYDVFKDKTIYSLLENAVQIFIEFHYVKQNLNEIAQIIEEFKKTHSLVHIHANNHADFFEYNGKRVPGAIEVSFLSNAFLQTKEPSSLTYPVDGLDKPCNRLKEDTILDFFN